MWRELRTLEQTDLPLLSFLVSKSNWDHTKLLNFLAAFRLDLALDYKSHYQTVGLGARE